MAHVKVARRSMDKKQWIAIRVKWLKDHITKETLHMTGWNIQEARQVKEMDYEMIGENHPIQDGDMYFTPDGTVFLSNTVSLPESWIDEDVWFYFETAAEMMVKVNDVWVGGVDPNRQRIQIKKAEDKTLTFELFMEGYNRSKPDDERNLETSHLRGCRQVFNGGELLLQDPVVESAYYDAKLLLETIQCEYIEPPIVERIETALHEGLLSIPFEHVYGEINRDALHEGIHAFQQYITEKVFNEETAYHIGKVALVAHSHLDIAYYWRRIHTVQKNARTCLIQLDLMDKYPDFKYAHTQAYTYETLEKYYPDIFNRVRDKIKEGQFEVVGGMYIEPDCNIPSAESLIRQCLYGQSYFQEKFDLTVNNCWLPDVFGNSWILPQILRKSGMDYFVSNKMSTWNDTNRFPHNNFIWKGIDGSDIFACVPPTHFISWNTPEQLIENWETFQDRDKCDETLNMFGYGDGGSGATEEMIEYMHRLNRIPSIPESRHIRGEEFLKESIREDQNLDTWDGELYLEMHRGTFTTKGYLKRMNRLFEIQMRQLEYFWTVAALKGAVYPKEAIDELWKLLLINQFHDILPGTHIAPVERDVRVDYEFMEERIRRLTEEALEALGMTMVGITGEAKVDTTHYTSSPIEETVLYNTLSGERRGVEFVEHVDSSSIARSHCVQQGVFQGKEGSFVELSKVDAFAPATIADIEENQQTQSPWFTFEDKTLVTPFYRVTFDDKGAMTSLYKRKTQQELVEPGNKINDLHLYHDYPGMYDAWDVLPSYRDLEDVIDCVEPIRVVESGPVFIALEVRLKSTKSTWKQIIRFYHRSEAIDLDFEVDWHEKQRLAKLEFNLNILARQIACDTSAGTIYRDTHKNTTWQQARFEVCMHKYVDMYEPGSGLAIINNGKYGVSTDKNQLGISLLRGTVRPDNHSDMGFHRFALRLLPHEMMLEESGIVEAAWAYNVPLVAMKKTQEATTDLRVIETDEKVFVQSVKMPQNAAKAQTMIVRLTELHGRRGQSVLTFNQKIKQVKTVDMLERAVDVEACRIVEQTSNTVTVAFNPYEITTLEIEF